MVLGPEGSGKTNLWPSCNRRSTGCGPGRHRLTGADVDGFWARHAPVAPGTVLLVDDAANLGTRAQEAVAALVAAGAAAVAAARPGPLLLQQVPLALQARAGGRGMVLSPRSGAEADFFGVRLDDGWETAGTGLPDRIRQQRCRCRSPWLQGARGGTLDQESRHGLGQQQDKGGAGRHQQDRAEHQLAALDHRDGHDHNEHLPHQGRGPGPAVAAE